MKYAPTDADRAPAPTSYRTEDRYIGYRETDSAKPWASYFTENVSPVQEQVTDALASGRADERHGYGIEDAVRRMERPGYEEMETGYTRLPDGRVLVSALTRMPSVTADMWDWWFGWHGTDTSRYKLWHPEAHYFTAVGDDRSADRSLTDKQRYIDNVSYVDEYIGDDKSQLTVRFIDPEKVGFETRPGDTTIVARGGASTAPIAFAWLVHQVRATDDGCEMRSRFFVNDIQVLRLPMRSIASRKGMPLATPLGSLLEPLIRRAGGVEADHFGPAMLRHCGEEMNHLATFLPRLHAEFKDTH